MCPIVLALDSIWSNEIPASKVFFLESTVGPMNTSHQLSNVMYLEYCKWLESHIRNGNDYCISHLLGESSYDWMNRWMAILSSTVTIVVIHVLSNGSVHGVNQVNLQNRGKNNVKRWCFPLRSKYIIWNVFMLKIQNPKSNH